MLKARGRNNVQFKSQMTGVERAYAAFVKQVATAHRRAGAGSGAVLVLEPSLWDETKNQWAAAA
jgi:hypothetical protein